MMTTSLGGERCSLAYDTPLLRSKFADGQHAEIMEVLRLGELEVERSMANPFRKFTALLTEVCPSRRTADLNALCWPADFAAKSSYIAALKVLAMHPTLD